MRPAPVGCGLQEGLDPGHARHRPLAGFDFLDDAAADDDRVGDLRHAARGFGVADAEAHADRQPRARRGSRGILALDIGKIDVRGAGDAPQRDVVEVAAADPRHLARCASPSRSARAGRSDRCRLSSPARRTARTPRADSRPRSRRRRRPLWPRQRRTVSHAHRFDRVGVAHEHDRRLVVGSCGNSATMPSTSDRPTPCFSARSPARWITGPSAIGSENGTPSSMMSAPASTSPCISGTVSAGCGSPAVM